MHDQSNNSCHALVPDRKREFDLLYVGICGNLVQEDQVFGWPSIMSHRGIRLYNEVAGPSNAAVHDCGGEGNWIRLWCWA